MFLARPSSKDAVGQEAVDLAESVMDMTASHKRRIIQPVLNGFEYNFQTESSEEGPWQELAARTKEEREELGFPREHPILERTGSYRASWIKRGHPNHLEVEVPIRASNTLALFVGSKDPRVGPLSGGFEPARLEDAGEEAGIGDGFLPPRPVAPIREGYARSIGYMASAVLHDMAKQVKTG